MIRGNKSRTMALEESRNRRLWFRQVVIPVLAIGGMVITNEGARDYLAGIYTAARAGINDLKAKIKSRSKA